MNRPRILVIDDEPLLMRAIERLLRRTHDVTLCETGAAAMQMLAAGARFDVILCDVHMPAMSGLDFLHAAELLLPLGCRFVFMTAGTLSEDVDEALRQTGLPRLEKPFATADLLRVVSPPNTPPAARMLVADEQPLAGEAPTILLVEDDDDDAEMVRRALARASLVNPCHRVDDGAACLEWLGRHALPVVVLLDLRLPKIDGIAVLRHVRGHPSLAGLPVIVLTASRHDEDFAVASALRVEAFLRKPVAEAKLLHALALAGVAVLPAENHANG